MEKLPPMGEDAFAQGFLSKKFGQRIIDRANRPWKVVMPPNAGSGKVLESDENVVLDLSLAKMGVPAAFNGNRMHPWQCYITSNQPDNVKLKINEYSCLMGGQSKHNYFSELRWNDRVQVANFSEEFPMTQPSDEIWLVVYFESNGVMNLNPAGNGPYMYQSSGLINNPYQTNYPTPTYLTTDELFKWRQLIAYWEATTGDMIPDATFDGTSYTLRCPTTTHLKESIVRGYAAGNYEEIKDYPCLVPWYGCGLTS